MKKIIFILVLMITLQISYGQTLKTETEKYKDGVITYQGYEKSETMDFIKHGTFKFVENLKGKYGSWNVLVTGTFKNGLRNGLWTYSIKQIDAENNDGTYTTGTLLYTQIFKDGNPDGLCNYKNTYKTREIICDYYGHCKWGIYSRIENESANTPSSPQPSQDGCHGYAVNMKASVPTDIAETSCDFHSNTVGQSSPEGTRKFISRPNLEVSRSNMCRRRG